jgi:excisionase family DNA binding protein
MEESNAASSEQSIMTEYISVGEAAKILGLTTRTVYWYIEMGKLPCTRIDTSLLLRIEDVTAFQRRAPGKIRTGSPRWRLPPEPNALSLTIITVQVRPGQRTVLTERLAEMHRENRYTFPGTAARYIMTNQRDPNEITVILVWRLAISSAQTRRKALKAWMADFADVFDWDTARTQSGQGLLHA